MKDTTGQLVITFTDSGTTTLVARDHGWYKGTKPEYNVRKLETLRTLALTMMSQAVVAVTSRVEGYGCSWGDTFALFSVTDEDVADLVAYESDVLAARRKAREVEDAFMAAPVRRGVGWCDKRGSYCFGDCEAGNV